MIRSTFLHLPGVGPSTERRLWEAGHRDWDSVWQALRSGSSVRELLHRSRQRTLFSIDDETEKPDSPAIAWLDCLDQSRIALEGRNYAFFLELLRPSDHWRLLRDVLSDALFLDIETTGLSRDHHYVTVIGAMYRGQVHQWVWSQDLEELRELLAGAPVVITFNGARFDLPFIAEQLPGLPAARAHIDLLYPARAAGLSGGQKEIERLLGLLRAEELEGFDGLEAVAAWCAGLYGESAQYGKLLAYNRVDVEMLPRLAAALWNRLTENDPGLPQPAATQLPLQITTGHEPLPFEALQSVWCERRPEFSCLKPRLDAALGREAVVVGIDLRAKPERPTGLAVCRGTATETEVLFTDEEIIERTLAAKPDLVSIDAPLFLPRGRESVSDDSPCREKGGIVRDAERVLWSRGIRVYPALIRQMQGLTARGIALTRVLQEKGVPVIESYPGAAQDVLNIPRKKQDESLLARGLQQFGYKFEGAKTHDELDAITSALVGHFYLAGEYEGIGAPDEGYMIIPKAQSMHWHGGSDARNPVIASLIGLPGAGKTTLARELAKRFGWRCFVLGDALRELAGKNADLKRRLDDGEMAPEPIVEHLITDVIRETSEVPLILDGFPRHKDQLSLLARTAPQWLAVHLDVSSEVAAERLSNRRVCLQCKESIPNGAATCLTCGSSNLRQRPEDAPPTIKPRLRAMEPLLADLVAAIADPRLLRMDATMNVDDLLSALQGWISKANAAGSTAVCRPADQARPVGA